MKGYGDGRFGIGDAITKEEMIACLVRYIDYLGLSLDSDHIPKYSDESQVSAWAEDSINFCKYAGILKGGEIENCGAKEPAKKGEAAEYLCRVYDYIESRNTAQSAMIELVFM